MITVIEIGGRCIYTGHTFTFMVSVSNTLSLSCYSYSCVLLFYCPLTGVYISKIMYVRRGERSLDGYYKPYHTVVYYRYLRFFPDGMYNIHSSILYILSKPKGKGDGRSVAICVVDRTLPAVPKYCGSVVCGAGCRCGDVPDISR